MGLKFLDRVALGINGSSPTQILAVVGTAMIAYGVYKLAEKALGLGKDNYRPERKFKASKGEDFEEFESVDIEDEDEEVKEEVTRQKEVVKHIGWIFGGVVLKELVYGARNWGYRRLMHLYTGANNNFLGVLNSVSNSLGDISRLSIVAQPGERAGMEKAVEFVTNGLYRDGFYRR